MNRQADHQPSLYGVSVRRVCRNVCTHFRTAVAWERVLLGVPRRPNLATIPRSAR